MLSKSTSIVLLILFISASLMYAGFRNAVNFIDAESRVEAVLGSMIEE